MILTIAMQKGGTGKTTSAAIMAQAAARCGLDVLLIDLDPQSNLTAAVGTEGPGDGDTYKLLTGEKPAEQIQRTRQEHIDIIPGAAALSILKTGPGSARRLKEALEPIRARYDLVIIDTPPTVGELQYNALMAANKLIIPVKADKYCLQGLSTIIENAEAIKQSNKSLRLSGIFFTQYRQQSDYEREYFKKIINEAVRGSGLPYLGTVRPSDKVPKAAREQVSLYEYAPRCTAAVDYMGIFHEVTNGMYTQHT